MKLLVLYAILFLSGKLLFADESNFEQNNFDKQSYSFSEIYDNSIESIVYIKIYYDSAKDENVSAIYDFFFGSTYNCTSGGSGFIYSDDGYIITDHHVVDCGNTYKIILYNGEECFAKLIGSDERTDVAVLKIEKENLPHLLLDYLGNVTVGEWVMGIGNPLRNTFSLAVGIVGGKNRQIYALDIEDFIQIDGVCDHGFSGAPIFNMSGNIIGMISYGIGENIGYAIPTNIIKPVVEQLIKNGQIIQTYPGIRVSQYNKTEIGIIEVLKNSPAHLAGLMKNDRILEYNGIPITTVNSLANYISLLEPEDNLTLLILRNGEYLEKLLDISELPEKKVWGWNYKNIQ